MNHSACVWGLVVFVWTLPAGISLATEVPLQTFSLNNAIVGVTTLSDLQAKFGPAVLVRVSREDEADVNVCYIYSSAGGRSFLTFEFGVMGSADRITGFRISTMRPRGKCSPTTIDVGALKTENGIGLRQGFAEFKKAIPVEFKRRGSELTFESTSRRAANPEELRKLRARWPDEKQDYFDVTTNVRAKFNSGQLVDFFIRRIESY